VIRVIVAGEGSNELGGFWVEAEFRAEAPEPGVIEALLRQVRRDGWQVVDALRWTKLPKLQVGIGKKGEEFNVQRAFHHARKRGCDVLVFSRDRDGIKFAHREAEIERAIEALSAVGGGPAVAGAVAIERLEAWVLAIAGVRRSEDLRRPEDHLADIGAPAKDTAAMVALVENRGLAAIPEDARSFLKWLARAREAMGAQAAPGDEAG